MTDDGVGVNLTGPPGTGHLVPVLRGGPGGRFYASAPTDASQFHPYRPLVTPPPNGYQHVLCVFPEGGRGAGMPGRRIPRGDRNPDEYPGALHAPPRAALNPL